MTHPLPPRRPGAATPRQQQGAALIVTVLLMLVISLLGLTAMMRNNLDERMSFNQRDRQVALQAAEAALREAEDGVDARFGSLMDESVFIGLDDCAQAQGWCYPRSDAQNWSSLAASEWTNQTSTRTLSMTTRAAITGVSAQPRFLIEYQGTAGPIDPGDLCVAQFLITARATGLNTNSTVTLQSQYRRRIGICQSVI